MTDDTSGIEDILRRHYHDHDHITPTAVDAAKALYGLRRLDDELIELFDSELAVRGGDDDDILQFVYGDVTLLVRMQPGGVEIIVSPPDTDVALESEAGPTQLGFDERGVVTVDATGIVRLRIRLADGTSGVTDGFDTSGTDE